MQFPLLSNLHYKITIVFINNNSYKILLLTLATNPGLLFKKNWATSNVYIAYYYEWLN